MRFELDAVIGAAGDRWGLPGFDLPALEKDGLALLAEDVGAGEQSHWERLAAYGWIANQVSIRAALGKRRLARPETARTPLPAPVFIIAAGRTGSTLLHWLLARHPALRAPARWELWWPVHEGDEGLRRAAMASCAEDIRATPVSALKLHPVAVDLPDECHWILLHNTIRSGLHEAPAFGQWLWGLDRTALAALLEDYRQVVLPLQAITPGRRWLSKTFAHAHAWPVLFDIFPDAQVIRLHRDPRHSLASVCSLFHQLSPDMDHRVRGERIAFATLDGQARMMAADAAAPPGQIIDVFYEDLRRDPAGTVVELARWLGLPAIDAYGADVDRYLASQQGIRAAPHTPSLEDFGLSDTTVLDYFEPYVAWVRARCDPGFAR